MTNAQTRQLINERMGDAPLIKLTPYRYQFPNTNFVVNFFDFALERITPHSRFELIQFFTRTPDGVERLLWKVNDTRN